MTQTAICTNRTTNGTTDPVVATGDTLYLVLQGSYLGVRVDFEAAFVTNPSATDWVGVPDMTLSQERTIWPLCVNQMNFRAPKLRARISGAGPDTKLTVLLTDGLAV